jgi:pantoate--beta-alanine ligase
LLPLVIKDIQQFIAWRGDLPNSKRLSFVPTMGNLHQGHAKLVAEARAKSDIVVVSIFLNPIQFNNPDDYDRYPKTVDKDIEVLQQADVALLPTANQIYPRGFDFTRVLLDLPEKYALCGKSRQGHFDGVLTVVAKLLTLVRPQLLFMGEKDYQQSLLIKRLIETFFFNMIKMIVVPTQRESNGLACSSRNNLLSDDAKARSANIYDSLLLARTLLEGGMQWEQAKKQVVNKLLTSFTIDYLEFLDDQTLTNNINNNRLFIAASIDDVRLIDNLRN